MNLIRRIVSAVALVLLASACGTSSETPRRPPDCPYTGILSDAAKVRLFAEGGGRTVSDVAYDAELTRAAVTECEWRDNKIVSKVRVEFLARFGPAARSSTYQLPYFVVISDPDGKLLAKDVFTRDVEFGAKNLVVRGAFEIEDIFITPPEGASGEGYEVLLGIQLTREQLEYNRNQVSPQPLDLLQ